MDQAETGRLRGEARETVRAAAADLGGVADRFSVLPEGVEAQARILDRLSQELAEAASMLRHSTLPGADRLGIALATTYEVNAQPADSTGKALVRPG